MATQKPPIAKPAAPEIPSPTAIEPATPIVGMEAVRIERDYVPARVPEGTVMNVWGDAVVRKLGGDLHQLTVGEVINKGDMVLTSQNGIVEINVQQSINLEPLPPTELGPPNFDGSLGPALRIDRIQEPLSSLTLNSASAEIAPTSGLDASVLGGLTVLPGPQPTPVILSVSSTNVGEGDGFAVFQVTLSRTNPGGTGLNVFTSAGTATPGLDYGSPSAGPVATPNAAANSADLVQNALVSTDGGLSYQAASGVVLPAGETTLLVRVPVIDDHLHEPNETFQLTVQLVGSGLNASGVGTATIVDNDPIVVSLLDGNGAEGSSSAGTVTFKAALANPSSTATTLAFSLGGAGDSADPATDLTGQVTFTNGVTRSADGSTISVPAGVTQFDISVQVSPDKLVESDETFTVSLTGPTNAASAIGTIANDDAAPVVQANTFGAREGDPVQSMNLSVPTDANGDNLTVTITAINLTAGSGTLTTPAGSAVAVGTQLTVAEFNALQYLAPADFVGSTSTPTPVGGFQYAVTDGANTRTGSVAIELTATNDAPNLPLVQAGPILGTEDLPLVLSKAITVSDPDVGDILTAVVKVGSGTLTLTAAASGALTSLAGDHSASVTLTGTADQINAALDGATYLGLPDHNTAVTGAIALSVDVTDAAGATSPTATSSIALAAVDDILSTTLQGTVGRSVEILRADLLAGFEDPAAKVVSIVDKTGANVTFDATHTSVAVQDGAVHLSASGDLIFTPNAGYVSQPNGVGVLQTTSFDYFVRSSSGDVEATTMRYQITAPGAPDTFTGQAASRDVFAWQLADAAPAGAAPHPFTINAFDPASARAPSSGDVLDLRDLLSNESGSTIGSFLHFDNSTAGKTVVQIDSTGGATFVPDVSIVLNSVSFATLGVIAGSNDQQIAQHLIDQGKLLIDNAGV